MRQPQRQRLTLHASRLTRFKETAPQFAVASRYSPLPHPLIPPQQRPRILGHNFSRVRVPDIWRPPSLHKLPSTHQLQPTNLRNILPPHQINSRASPAGHLGISKS
eukprot:scaffold17145_cov59-Phaeocystis_antarctica.AAC.1